MQQLPSEVNIIFIISYRKLKTFSRPVSRLRRENIPRQCRGINHDALHPGLGQYGAGQLIRIGMQKKNSAAARVDESLRAVNAGLMSAVNS